MFILQKSPSLLMNATFVIPRVDNRLHFTAPRISFQTHKGVLGKICF
ncbi:hypothetical protein APHNP_0331 [Anaplasma phagocytophilum str. ApNP]|uniref:Uncharacterized protein n=1 Tax=Anaplasma phagocytophilum str. ApNP TaxID=1359153 RepID=A0A0F3NHK9_ANAPH|nr:hypothetical protein APHNP_0331 [Anaplasma phagocytophilum str. ApNP]